VSFGACHTEFVCGGPCGTRLIEVNDRLIGDHDEFLLNDLLEEDLFELVLRVSLGERLPASTPPLAPLHAVASYIRAESSGVLVAAPAPGPMADAEPGVQLSYWPCLEPGSQVAVTNSNRDYLGVLTALGPSADAVERSLTVARERGGWEISS
jgi:biotin carboxylase